MYAKNEVSRYKTKKKTIWDCTLPLSACNANICHVRHGALFWVPPF